MRSAANLLKNEEKFPWLMSRDFTDSLFTDVEIEDVNLKNFE